MIFNNSNKPLVLKYLLLFFLITIIYISITYFFLGSLMEDYQLYAAQFDLQNQLMQQYQVELEVLEENEELLKEIESNSSKKK